MRLVCLLLLASAAASAQPVDSTAARRPRVSSLTLGPLGVAASPDDGDLLLFGIRYLRSVGPAPLVAEIGATEAIQFSIFGSGSPLAEAHLAFGAVSSSGPLLLTAVAGPSVAEVRRSPSTDPDFDGYRSRVVPGLFAAVRATLVLFPAVGIGAEVFAHGNAKVPTVGAGLTFSFGRLPGAVFSNPPPRPRRPGP